MSIRSVSLKRALLGAAALAAVGWLAAAVVPQPTQAANPCNPCAAKANPCNPCGMKGNPCNPCGMKANPCGMNPCGGNPCGMNPCNPCGGNPCNPCGGAMVDPAKFKKPAGVTLPSTRSAALVAKGEKLWNDPSLSTNGLACATCHAGKYAQMNASFAKPYPHRVNMPAQMAGVSEVSAAEMTQFCMLQPMQAEPFDWDDQRLVALTAYVENIQADFKPQKASMGSNPCNPCAMKGNPCNPCGMKGNPCNPCAGR